MTYVALLRGINVGGNNIIDMKRLKASFERAGLEKVQTYINSGNIIFTHKEMAHQKIISLLEHTIYENFNLSIKVLIRSINQIETIMESLPENWTNDKIMKSNVIFLWDEIDSPDIIDTIELKPGVDEAFYLPGTILWSISTGQTNKSGLKNLVGTKIYKKMTIRNVNTFRKIYSLMK